MLLPLIEWSVNEMDVDHTRDNRLRERLSPGVCKLLDKFRLHSDENGVWCSDKENAFPKRIAKQSYLERRSLLAAVFRVHELCAGKLNYFEQHWGNYEACRYDPDRGFIPVELWDMEFIRHMPSGKLLDLRYLQGITEIENFMSMCRDLEKIERGEPSL